MITKDKFDSVYNKYLPAKWIVFAFKHFFKNKIKEHRGIGDIITSILILTFAGGFIATVLNLPKGLIGFFTIIYLVVLTVLVSYLVLAITFNNIRIKKIYNELGITQYEYNKLVEKFYK